MLSQMCVWKNIEVYQEVNPLAILCWTRVSRREWTIADISHRECKNLAHFDYFVANLCILRHAFTGLSNMVVRKNDKYQVWSGPKKLQEITLFTILLGEGNRVYGIKTTRKNIKTWCSFGGRERRRSKLFSTTALLVCPLKLSAAAHTSYFSIMVHHPSIYACKSTTKNA